MKILFNLIIFFGTINMAQAFPQSWADLIMGLDRVQYDQPENYNIQSKEYFIKSRDGHKLNVHYLYSTLKNKPSKSLVVFFQGRSQNSSHHFKSIAFLTYYGHDVLVFDYSGSGKSEGRQSFGQFIRDGADVIHHAKYLQDQQNIPKLIIYAQSMGGPIALQSYYFTQRNFKADLFVLDSSFFSFRSLLSNLTETGAELLKTLGTKELQKLEAEIPLKGMDTKVLFIHGLNDYVVPYNESIKAFTLVPTQKQMWFEEDAGHIEYFVKKGKTGMSELAQYFDSL